MHPNVVTRQLPNRRPYINGIATQSVELGHGQHVVPVEAIDETFEAWALQSGH
jgi:hypothetical protein